MNSRISEKRRRNNYGGCLKKECGFYCTLFKNNCIIYIESKDLCASYKNDYEFDDELFEIE